jgi:hypothetical protein
MEQKQTRRNIPAATAFLFASVNLCFWIWFLRNPISHINNPGIESGIGVMFVGMVLMGLGSVLYFMVAGVWSGLYHAGLIGTLTSQTTVNVIFVLCGLTGWAATGFGLAKIFISITDSQGRKRHSTRVSP